MKNLKKVLAFTLALAMILSTMTTAFAANEWADKLSNLGLLLNTTDEELNTELTRSVGLAMVLKALGYSQADADVAAERNTFVDMGNATWAKGFAVIGEELKITNGVSVEPKMFAPEQKLDKKSFVAFMLRALGYDLNEAWAKAGELGAAAKLIEQPEIEKMTFNKGEAAMIMYNALKAEVQGDAEKRSLAQKLVDEGKLNKDLAVANGLLEAAPATLEVESVSATNLREVNVEFNTVVDKTSAEKASNYKLKGKSIKEAMVKEDGKTVVLTVDGALANKKETKLTVTGVKTEAGVAIEKTEKLFTPFDNQYPKVEKITFTGPKNLSIQFSEPIKNSERAAVTLKSDNRKYSAKVDKVEGNVAYVTAYTSFKSGAEYLVAIGDPNSNDRYFYDYANYPNTYYEETLTYEKDTTAPEAEVKSANQKVVKVAFNKPVTGVNLKHFYHSFASYEPRNVYKTSKLEKVVSATNEVSEVYVVFYSTEGNQDKNHALPAGDVTLTILGKADDKSEIKDAWGNKFETTNIALTIVADREAPEVVEVEVTGEKTAKITFNEAVSNGDKATYTLTDKNGSVVRSNSQITKTVSANKKSVELNFNKSYAGKTMILSVKGIKDDSLYQNMMGEYSSEIDFTDKVWEGIEKVEYKKVEGQSGANPEFYLYVTYKEDMGESATNSKNYKIQVGNNTPVNLQGEGDFYEGRSSIVRFALTFDKENPSKATDVMAISGSAVGDKVIKKEAPEQDKSNVKLLVSQEVKDLAGNAPDKFQVEKEITDLVSTAISEGIASAKATAADRIEVKFAQEMAAIDGSEFYVMFETNTDPKDNKYEIGGYNVVDNKTLELFLTARDKSGAETVNKVLFGTDVAGDGKEAKVSFKSGDNTKDIFGRSLDSSQKVVIEDKIAPSVAKLKVVEVAGANPDLQKAMEAGNYQFNLRKIGTSNDIYEDQPAVMGIKEGADTYVVKVGYTEKIKETSISTTTYSFNNSDYQVKSVENAGDTNVVTITLEKKADDKTITADDLTALKGLTITQDSTILDMSNNSYIGAGTLNVMQFVPVEKGLADEESVILTGTKEKAKVIITFKADLKANTAQLANFSLVGGDSSLEVDTTDADKVFAIKGKTITIPVSGTVTSAGVSGLKIKFSDTIIAADNAETEVKAAETSGIEIVNKIKLD